MLTPEAAAEAASFKAYLFAIAANQLYAHIRRHTREGERIDFAVTSAMDLGLSPSAAVALRERDQQLALALRSLPCMIPWGYARRFLCASRYTSRNAVSANVRSINPASNSFAPYWRSIPRHVCP